MWHKPLTCFSATCLTTRQCPSTFLGSPHSTQLIGSLLGPTCSQAPSALDVLSAPLCLLRSSHFSRSSPSIASFTNLSVYSKTIALFVSLPHLWLVLLFNTVDDVFVDGNSHHSQRTQHVAGTMPSTLWVLSPFNPFTRPESKCSDRLFSDEEMEAQKCSV